jgi:hypothetical protein
VGPLECLGRLTAYDRLATVGKAGLARVPSQALQTATIIAVLRDFVSRREKYVAWTGGMRWEEA